MIRNVNDDDSADASHGNEIISIADLSNNFLNGPIFDPICQNAALGPWEEISNNWDAWQTKLKCHHRKHAGAKLRFQPSH